MYSTMSLDTLLLVEDQGRGNTKQKSRCHGAQREDDCYREWDVKNPRRPTSWFRVLVEVMHCLSLGFL